jgi:hypothetical protein
LLTTAYLLRDRETKLRVYPGVAPFLAMPIMFMFSMRGPAGESGFGLALASSYLSLVPMLAATMVCYSQHWQAADIFRTAPIAGPGPLCNGARQAVIFCLAVPLMLAFIGLAWVMAGWSPQLCLLLPGLISMPVFAMMPSVDGQLVPLSRPGDDAKAATRGVAMIGMMMLAMLIGGAGVAAWHMGFFWWLVAVEAVVAVVACLVMRRATAQARWASAE